MANSDHQNPGSDSSIAHQYQTHSMTSGLLSGSQQVKPEGLDYSLQRSSGDIYTSMMPPARSHIPNQGLGDRRSTNSNQVYGTYDHTTQSHATLNYGTPNATNSLGASNALSQMSKAANSGASNSPPQSTWTPRHLTRVRHELAAAVF